MFVGHFGVGFAAKSSAPETSLGTLFLAAQWLDIVWPTLLLAGLERVEIVPGITAVTPLDFTHYPITHSLLAVIGWSLLFGSAYYLLRRYPLGAWVCAALVLSHWLLDAVVHRPDLELWPGSVTRIGLGLWNWLPVTLAVELPIFALGVWLYLRTTRPRDRAGTLGLWALVGFLLLIYGMNLLGPPPPSVSAIAWLGQAQWLLVVAGYAVDRHRVATR